MTGARAISKEALALADVVTPLFSQVDPEVIGMAIAELAAVWLACHAPDERASVFELWSLMLHDLVKLHAAKSDPIFHALQDRKPTP